MILPAHLPVPFLLPLRRLLLSLSSSESVREELGRVESGGEWERMKVEEKGGKKKVEVKGNGG